MFTCDGTDTSLLLKKFIDIRFVDVLQAFSELLLFSYNAD